MLLVSSRTIETGKIGRRSRLLQRLNSRFLFRGVPSTGVVDAPQPVLHTSCPDCH